VDYRELERYAEEYWRRKADLVAEYSGPVFTMNPNGISATYVYDYQREWRAKGVRRP
jgi:hypothetical protein